MLIFASGDFGFNLYWQSVMLYLLFYYTEALHLPIAVASAAYAIASVWDGIANFGVGLLAERYARPQQLRLALVYGGIPLGFSFALTYAPPTATGAWLVALILAGQLVFRTAYALVNVPYLAMSARISLSSEDRALVAGARMLFGTLAAVAVALGTIPLGRLLAGAEGASAYATSALCFAVVGGILITLVGIFYRDDAIPSSLPSGGTIRAVGLAFRNKAFLSLSLAVMAMIVAVTVLDKSVLYYFKYVLLDQAVGQSTLGWMMAVSGAAVPIWVLVSRRLGVRGSWFLGAAACIACLSAFVVADITSVRTAQIFLIAVQTGMVGLHFSFWAMLPDTVEYGQQQFGVRSEAVLYGLSAFFQRLAIGAGTLLVGFGLSDGSGHPAEQAGFSYRLVLAVIPLAFFVLSVLIMLANPLKRGRHDEIVDRMMSA